MIMPKNLPRALISEGGRLIGLFVKSHYRKKGESLRILKKRTAKKKVYEIMLLMTSPMCTFRYSRSRVLWETPI